MNSILKKIDKVISVILSSLVAIIAIGIIATVFMRYLFGLSYNFVEEFLTICFASVIFMGSAICVREKQHISITYFVDKLPKKKKIISDIFVMVCIIAVSLIMFIYSIKWINAVGSTVSPSSGIRMGIFYSIVPISSLITIFYCVIDILSNFVYIKPAEAGYFDDAELMEESK